MSLLYRFHEMGLLCAVGRPDGVAVRVLPLFVRDLDSTPGQAPTRDIEDTVIYANIPEKRHGKPHAAAGLSSGRRREPANVDCCWRLFGWRWGGKRTRKFSSDRFRRIWCIVGLFCFRLNVNKKNKKKSFSRVVTLSPC